MTKFLMSGDIVTVDLRVKHTAEPGTSVYLTDPDNEYSQTVTIPFEHCALRIPFLKPGDVVGVIGEEVEHVTVIYIDGDHAWVRDSDGARLTYQCGDLERLPPKRPKQETPPATPPTVQES